ncbi:MAG: enoyl-CoA hydratase-related protein [Gemmatimonadota bacterium]|nr:enoyl-CoA hydratase-related protein [Gemmatimonadota bacterium]
MDEHVRVERDRNVMTVTLNRPEAKNALTHAMYTAVADAIGTASREGVRCVVITGEGDAFTAGNDLGDFANPMPEGKLPVVRFLETLRDTNIPVLAAVNGVAVGVGLTMLMHCDLAFASENASFSAPFARVGLVPEAGSSMLLPRALGVAWANDILLAGRVLSAADALVAGLVSRVVPHDELGDLARTVSQQLATFAPNAMRESKRLIRSDRGQVAERMSSEAEVFFRQLASSEFSESVLAMREQRQPMFDL